jgi:hypothetical protein
LNNWNPTSALAQAVYAAGFLYDPDQDIIYSRQDAIQRKFGYAYGYDASALMMNMAIDCEPVFFEYDNKTWMIELWKGQYGLETGCEIGVYNRPHVGDDMYKLFDLIVGNRPHDPEPNHSKFFASASDAEMLEMSLTLKRDGQALFTRGPEKHWWLTGFKWGVFSRAEQLSVDISIAFPNPSMLGAFRQALTQLGYKSGVDGSKVSFTFDTPKTYQPRTDPNNAQLLADANGTNEKAVATYRRLNPGKSDPNVVQENVADIITDQLSIFGTFFTQAIANCAYQVQTAASQLADVLANGFHVAANEVSSVITNAGYVLSDWLNAVAGFLGLNLDFSCIVEIDNPNGTLLTRKDSGIDQGTFPATACGSYAIEPPRIVRPRGRERFLVQSSLPHGAEGWVLYADQGGDIRFSYGCPTGVYSNHIAVDRPSFKFYAEAGSGGTWGDANSVPESGHPLKIAFVAGDSKPRAM